MIHWTWILITGVLFFIGGFIFCAIMVAGRNNEYDKFIDHEKEI